MADPRAFHWPKHLLAALLCLSACTDLPPAAPKIKRWAAYYDQKLPASAFKDMDLVVFDRTYHPDIKPLQPRTTVLAYVSMGELHGHAPQLPQLKKEGLILADNTRWQSKIVDITHLRWQAMVLAQVAEAEKKGFDGVMLDTVDSPLYWGEQQSPTRAAAMREGAIRLIADIRAAHPRMKIMLNRGFAILPAVAQNIDFILAESILSKADDSTGQFTLVSPNSYQQAAEQLQRVVALAPQLHVLTLDYWKQNDVTGLQTLYAAHRAQGFIPYISTPDLRQFTPEPRGRHRR